MKKTFAFFGIGVILVLVLALLLFGEREQSPQESTTPPSTPVLQEDRILAIDITSAADNDYESAFRRGKDVGMQEVGLFFNWNAIESDPAVYENANLAIANMYYPHRDTTVSLTIAPIHTNKKVVPDDLRKTPFNDPTMIRRFTEMLDWVFTQIPDLELRSLVIGSEMDVYLGSDEDQWQQYRTFYREVRNHLREKHPNLPVAAEATFEGLTGYAQDQMKELNEYSDIIGVSYYPLEDFTVKDPSFVAFDFSTLTELYDKPIYFYQLGYPSSPLLDSSETKQSEFIREVFTAWDVYESQIKLIDFTWLHDLSQEAVRENEQFYGMTDDRFAAFLGSLGLRTYDGTDKEAFKTLQEEAEKRGW
jgi:hypothetical protein